MAIQKKESNKKLPVAFVSPQNVPPVNQTMYEQMKEEIEDQEKEMQLNTERNKIDTFSNYKDQL